MHCLESVVVTPGTAEIVRKEINHVIIIPQEINHVIIIPQRYRWSDGQLAYRYSSIYRAMLLSRGKKTCHTPANDDSNLDKAYEL